MADRKSPSGLDIPAWSMASPLAGAGMPLQKGASSSQLPRLLRSSSGAGLIDRSASGGGMGGYGGDLVVGSSGLRAVRTARQLQQQLELLAPGHLTEVRRALATLQTAGLHEVPDISGLNDAVVAKLATLPPTADTTKPEVMLSPALQTGLVFDFTQEELVDTDAVGKGLVGLRTLRSVRMRFCGTGIRNASGLGKGLKELSALKELHIDFSGCTSLEHVDDLAKAISVLYGLDTLYMNFKGCVSLESVATLGKALKALSALKSLTLNFADCAKLTTDAAVAIGSAISDLTLLVDLDLDVCGSKVKKGKQRATILAPGPLGMTNYVLQRPAPAKCDNAEGPASKPAPPPPAPEAPKPEFSLEPALQTGLVFDFTQEHLVDTDDVGRALVGLQMLTKLRMRFCGTGITNLNGLGKGLRELSGLKEVHIDCSGCANLTSVDGLAQSIAFLYGLDTLYLTFKDCVNLETVAMLGEAIKSLSGLKAMTLTFVGCTKLTTDSAVAIGSAISNLVHLVDLDLEVCGSRVKRGVQRPTILAPGPLGITNYVLANQPAAAGPAGAPAEAARSPTRQAGLAVSPSGSLIPAAHPPPVDPSRPALVLAPSLQTGLVFDFTQEDIVDPEDIGQGLVGLRTLSSLRLRFSGTTIANLNGLGKGLRELKALTELHVDFSGCANLSTVDEFAESIGVLDGLDTLFLNFPGCINLRSVAALGEAIKVLSQLKTLTLNFAGCDKLTTDATVALGSAISNLSLLVDLDLDVCGSKVKKGKQRPTILAPGPLGITNHILQR